MIEVGKFLPMFWVYVAWAKTNWLVGIPLFLSLLTSALFGGRMDRTWYKALRKPSLTPPNWVFPIVWPILYLMIGYSLQLVFGGVKTVAQLDKLRPQLLVISLNLLLNYSWSIFFFRKHKISNSLLICLGIFSSALGSIYLFEQVNPLAAKYLWAYCGWTGFASFLNWRLHVLNRAAGGPQLSAKKRK